MNTTVLPALAVSTNQKHQPLKTPLQKRSLRAAGLAIAIGLTSSAAQAATIIGNLTPANSLTSSAIGSLNQKAAVFTMGSQAYTVDSVILTLNGYDTATDVAQVGFFLEGADNFTPGAQVGSILTAPSSSSNDTADFTFLPSGSLTLQANTKYWLLVDTGATSFQWRGSNPRVAPSGTAATFDFFRLSIDNGSSYSNSGTYNSFQINGTQAIAVPEPGTFIPAALLVAGAFLRRRRSCVTLGIGRFSQKRPFTPFRH